VAALEESIGLTRNRIAALVGAGPDRGLSIQRPPAEAVKAFGLPAQLQANLLGRRPDVVAARLRVQAGEDRTRQAKAAFYPDVSLTGTLLGAITDLTKLSGSAVGVGVVGPAISLPIFDGGRLDAQYRGARADHEAAVAEYDRTVTQALRDVADVTVSQRALATRLARSRDALTSAQAAHKIARDRYQGGLSTYLEVLRAEDALIANRRAVADLETRAFVLDIALVRALGGGFKADQA
jgi:NodT family efflux transporter outer membrane factor (OMF) lipoprotein